jgi:hypothetical protein
VFVCERGGAEEKVWIKERKLQEARDSFIVRRFRNLTLRSASLRLQNREIYHWLVMQYAIGDTEFVKICIRET